MTVNDALDDVVPSRLRGNIMFDELARVAEPRRRGGAAVGIDIGDDDVGTGGDEQLGFRRPGRGRRR